jgi:hypothetical protein
MASLVGTTTSWSFRRLASFLTSVITGKAPVPVPTTSRRHFQGIFSSIESGVWPKALRNFLEGFFLRLRTFCVWQLHLAHFGSLIWPTLMVNGLRAGFRSDLLIREPVVEAVGMWESAVVADFQGRWEGWKTCCWFSRLSTVRHFHS